MKIRTSSFRWRLVFIQFTLTNLCAAVVVFDPRFLLGSTQSHTVAVSREFQGRTIQGKVVDENGRALSDATVRIMGVGSPVRTARLVQCNEEGYFLADQLMPGTYRLTPKAPAYVALEITLASGEQEETHYQPGDTVTLRMSKGGVISGSVINDSGQPAVGARVNAIRKGKFDRDPWSNYLEAVTDDRGIYRLYGLSTGNYFVQAGGGAITRFLISPYQQEGSVFYSVDASGSPSVVTVSAGEEVGNVDIRLRGLLGHIVSGTVNGLLESKNLETFAWVHLLHAESGALESMTNTWPGEGSLRFVMGSIPDGLYLAVAQSERNQGILSLSNPLPITVRGTDVSNLRLALKQSVSVKGRIILEGTPETRKDSPDRANRSSPLQGILVRARLIEKQPKNDLLNSLFPTSAEDAARANGEFLLRDLVPGRYRLKVRFPADYLFVKGVHWVSSKDQHQFVDVARQGLQMQEGQEMSGLQVSVAEGAARIAGRLIPADQNVPLPERVRVFLIPSEPEAADNVLRYRELIATGDYQFKFSNIAPGQYWLLSHSEEQRKEPKEQETSFILMNSARRQQLRLSALKTGVAVTLPAHSLIENFDLTYSDKKVASAP